MTPQSSRPSPPNIDLKAIVKQFWADIFGKEVQSAATYSYLWIADQGGHIGLGILLHFLAYVVLDALHHGGDGDNLAAMLLTWAAVAYWEWRAYSTSVKEATGSFPLDRTLLADNAIIATVYMAIGAAIGASFRLDFSSALPLVGALVGLALILAPRWIRQKMIWQKAALPYLSRLASATLGISPADAQALQGLLEQGAPPAVTPRQVLISGPIGSGRTSLTAGLGTEFAFRRTKVRYLTFDKFSELAQPPYGDYPGPKNIGFWPWRESQVVLIDDLNNALLPAAAHADQPPRLDTLRSMLKRLDTRLSGSLESCHSVWVLGDVSDLEPWAAEIRAFCKGQQPPLVVRLQLLADGTAGARGRR